MAYWEIRKPIPGGYGDGSFGSTGSSSTNVGGSQVISPLVDPTFRRLFEQAQGQVPMRNELQSLQQMIQGGVNSPLLSAVLDPALQRLEAPQAQQRQNLTEATRAAGGLRGSTYGQDFNQLMNNQALQTNDLMGQVIQQILSTLVSGQLQEQKNEFLPANALTDLLKTIGPNVVRGGGSSSSSSGWENIPPSLGLQTPMTPSTPGGDIASILRQLSSGGGATVGPNAPAPSANAPAAQPYTPYLDPLAGMGGGSYNLNQGAGTQYLGGPGAQQNPYQHTYGEWVPDNTVTEGWW